MTSRNAWFSVPASAGPLLPLITVLRSRGSPVGRRSLSLLQFAAAARSTVDCQRKVRRKQSCFSTQNIPISVAGVSGAVFCDTTANDSH